MKTLTRFLMMTTQNCFLTSATILNSVYLKRQINILVQEENHNHNFDILVSLAIEKV